MEEELLYAVVSRDYAANNKAQLPLVKNQLLKILDRDKSGWWIAKNAFDNSFGYIPYSYVRILVC